MESFNDTYILVDTSSLMDDGAEYIFETSYHFHFNNNKIIIPQSIVQEINKLAKHGDYNKKNRAKKAQKIVNKLISNNRCTIAGDNTNISFGDKEIIIAITNLRTRGDIALLSNDKKLCIDALQINNQKSIQSNYHIRAFNITNNGDKGYKLGKFSIKNFSKNNLKRNKERNFHVFNVCTNPITTKTPIYNIPVCKGDSLLDSSKNEVKLSERLGEGGEGIVYKTNIPGFCAKIYSNDGMTKELTNKLELMIKARFNHPVICWPKSILYKNDIPVGILIPEAKGEVAQISLCHPAMLKKMANVDKLDIVNILYSIIQAINFLHKHNVILGDINLQNIMIDIENKKAYLIDCDSYQIDSYPCGVGTVNFTAPEIQGENYTTFLRTKQHELFAVATLIFMFLLPGKPPYSQQGGGSPQENIKGKQFPYPFEGNSLKTAPEGAWKYMWSHLPYKVKKALYECFSKGIRIETHEWISLLNSYKNDLEQNYVSKKIFPIALKVPKKNNPIDVKCSRDSCGNEFEIPKDFHDKLQANGKPIICPVCLKRSRLERELNSNNQEKEKRYSVNSSSSNATNNNQNISKILSSFFNFF